MKVKSLNCRRELYTDIMGSEAFGVGAAASVRVLLGFCRLS